MLNLYQNYKITISEIRLRLRPVLRSYVWLRPDLENWYLVHPSLNLYYCSLMHSDDYTVYIDSQNQ